MDLFQLAGKNNAYTKTVTVSVTDGTLSILLTALVDNGSIAGLEIIRSGTAAPIVQAPTKSPVLPLRYPLENGSQQPPAIQASRPASIIASSRWTTLSWDDECT
jgi:hypothetical protein